MIRFLVRTGNSRVNRNGRKQLADVLPHKPFLREWFRCILMLCFSRPLKLVDSLYRNKRSARPTTVDFFQRDEETFGYNCCVSRLYSGTNEFNFSYNMDDLIELAKRLDSHEHRIPAYSVAALRHRQELIATNGDHDTFYAGAYLDFGLHEGAVRSANQVARLLGERSLEVAEPPQQL